MTNEVLDKENEVISIKQAVVQYDIAESTINEWNDRFMVLKVNDIKDKDTLALVTNGWRMLKDARMAVDVKRKDLKADSLEYGRKVDSEAKRLTELMKPIETHLKTQKDFVKEEKARIEQENAEKLQKLHDDRIQELINAGAVFNGYQYVYGYDNSFVKGTDISVIELDSWIELIESITTWKSEKDKKDEEIRIENERIANENAAEKKRLDEQQDKIDKQNEKLEKDKLLAKENERKYRASELIRIGLVFDGMLYRYQNITVDLDVAVDLDIPKFKESIDSIEIKIKDKKELESKEVERKQKVLSARIELVLKAGAVFVDNKYVYGDNSRTSDYISNCTDEDFIDLLAVIEDTITLQHQAAENDRIERNNQKSDTDKMLSLYESIDTIMYPNVTSKKAKDIVNYLQTEIAKLMFNVRKD